MIIRRFKNRFHFIYFILAQIPSDRGKEGRAGWHLRVLKSTQKEK